MATNLLILDEVFDSSLDQSATDELMKILKNKLDKTNLFVISHKGEVLIDRFDKTVEFKKMAISQITFDKRIVSCIMELVSKIYVSSKLP